MSGRSENAIKNHWNAAMRRQQRHEKYEKSDTHSSTSELKPTVATCKSPQDLMIANSSVLNPSSINLHPMKRSLQPTSRITRSSHVTTNSKDDNNNSNFKNDGILSGKQLTHSSPVSQTIEKLSIRSEAPQMQVESSGMVKVRLTADDVHALQVAELYLSTIRLAMHTKDSNNNGSNSGGPVLTDSTSHIVSQLVSFMKLAKREEQSETQTPTQIHIQSSKPDTISSIVSPIENPNTESRINSNPNNEAPRSFGPLRLQKYRRSGTTNGILLNEGIVTNSTSGSRGQADQFRSCGSSVRCQGNNNNGSGSGNESGKSNGSSGSNSWALNSINSNNSNSFLREFFKSPSLLQKDFNFVFDGTTDMDPTTPSVMHSGNNSTSFTPSSSTPPDGKMATSSVLGNSLGVSDCVSGNNSIGALSGFTFGSLFSSANSSTENLQLLGNASMHSQKNNSENANQLQTHTYSPSDVLPVDVTTSSIEHGTDRKRKTSDGWLARSLTPSPTSPVHA